MAMFSFITVRKKNTFQMLSFSVEFEKKTKNIVFYTNFNDEVYVT